MSEKTTANSAGGFARAKSLTPEQRKEIAEKAALARWGEKPPSAIHKGNFKREFGLDVECYVLNDVNKTAVITQLGMGEVLGLGSGGSRLPRFVFNKTMTEYIWPELADKIQNPIKFHILAVGQIGPMGVKANGYDVTILIDICKAILKAHSDGRLLKSQENVVNQANIIVNASAKAGIKGLVYALSGYNPSSEEVIAAFKAYIQEEAKKYEQEFPSELYMQWHRLYDLPVPVCGKPWLFKHLTVKHIYYPLAKSNGKIFDLIKANKAKDGDRQKKLFQFLNEVGARALRIQIGRVLEMGESSASKQEYEKKINDRFGDQRELDLVIP